VVRAEEPVLLEGEQDEADGTRALDIGEDPGSFKDRAQAVALSSIPGPHEMESQCPV
jgi:hypothetical protein